MPPFDDIGFLMMDIAQRCNVDAARIVVGGEAVVDLDTPTPTGFFIVGATPIYAPDQTRASILLLSFAPRVLSDRELTVLRAMALEAQQQLRKFPSQSISGF